MFRHGFLRRFDASIIADFDVFGVRHRSVAAGSQHGKAENCGCGIDHCSVMRDVLHGENVLGLRDVAVGLNPKEVSFFATEERTVNARFTLDIYGYVRYF